jgi:hypothetical protein
MSFLRPGARSEKDARRGIPMHGQLDSLLLPLAILSWPVTRSVVFLGASAVHMWSRDPARRDAARRLLRLLVPPRRDDRE